MYLSPDLNDASQKFPSDGGIDVCTPVCLEEHTGKMPKPVILCCCGLEYTQRLMNKIRRSLVRTVQKLRSITKGMFIYYKNWLARFCPSSVLLRHCLGYASPSLLVKSTVKVAMSYKKMKALGGSWRSLHWVGEQTKVLPYCNLVKLIPRFSI